MRAKRVCRAWRQAQNSSSWSIRNCAALGKSPRLRRVPLGHSETAARKFNQVYYVFDD
jgi:hypothetical protein